MSKKKEVVVVEKKKNLWQFPAFLFLLFVLALGVGAGGMYLYSQRNAPHDETTQLQNKLSAFMELPSETPTLATVSDVTKLQNQEFFTKAENGDKVLIYPNAKKAILYRPSLGKVINFGNINISNNQTAAVPFAPEKSATPSSMITSAPTPSKQIRIAIYNGTLRSGLAKTVAAKIEKDQTFSVIQKADAAKHDYAETVVVDLSGNTKGAKAVADMVHASVTMLPKDEVKPNADILVILGQNYQ